MAQAILSAKEQVKSCSICHNFSDEDICGICRSPQRDTTTICVVAEAKDLNPIERTREYKGLYHVLGGLISPMDGIGPEDIAIRSLVTRVGTTEVSEVILALSASIEAETSLLYIAHLLRPFPVKISRIGQGLPVGGELESADELTIAKALECRQLMN